MNLASCTSLDRIPLHGNFYHAIQPIYWNLAVLNNRYDAGFSTEQTSRFNFGEKGIPKTRPSFEIIYLADDDLTARHEVQDIFGSPATPGGIVVNPRQPRTIVHADVHLSRVVNLTLVTEQNKLATTAQELTGDWSGYQQRGSLSVIGTVSAPTGICPTQLLGEALFLEGDIEGVRYVSAHIPYHSNLAIFPQRLLATSSVEFENLGTNQRVRL